MMKRIACVLALLALATPARAHAPRSFLLSPEDNRLNAYDLATGAKQTVVDRQGDADGGGAGPLGVLGFGQPPSHDGNGRDINGQICVDPAHPTRFVSGEDTLQPNPPAGFAYFEASLDDHGRIQAEQIGKLTPRFTPQEEADTHGCAFLSDGRLLTATIGASLPFQPANGSVVLWFGPYDVYPGVTNPGGNEAYYGAVSSCKIDTSIATAGGMYADDEFLYVASNRPNDGTGELGGVFKYPIANLPASPDACTGTDAAGNRVFTGDNGKQVFVQEGPTALTPSSVTGDGHGRYYVSSVFSGTIAEFDREGTFKGFVLMSPPVGPGGEDLHDASITPFGITVGADGTLYVADLGNVLVGPQAGLGSVQSISFLELAPGVRIPLPPHQIDKDLTYPDGLGIISL